MILQRIPGERFSTILRAWEGEPVVILGGGPSLTHEQIKKVCEAKVVKDFRVVAVNDSYLLAPWADVLYAADYRWWSWHSVGIAKPMLGLSAAEVRERFAAFAGERCTIQHGDSILLEDRVHVVRNKTFPNHGVGLSSDQNMLVTGRNSAFQALNLSILAGAARVIFLGLDGKLADNGMSHFHGGHPSPTPWSLFFEEMRKTFSASEASIKSTGVLVLNCSPGSAIDAFTKADLEAAL